MRHALRTAVMANGFCLQSTRKMHKKDSKLTDTAMSSCPRPIYPEPVLFGFCGRSGSFAVARFKISTEIYGGPRSLPGILCRCGTRRQNRELAPFRRIYPHTFLTSSARCFSAVSLCPTATQWSILCASASPLPAVET